MKVAVILTGFLKDYVESYFKTTNIDCDLSFFIYENFAHAGELYVELEKDYDGFLVSGPVPRAAISRRVIKLNKPVVSFGSNALCYYETFFQVQYKERDFYLEHGYFDLLEWNPESRLLYQYLEKGEFNCLLYDVYRNTNSYTLEQLCEMEEKIKNKHIRLWKENKIQYSVTRFSNIMPELLENGVKTYFVYPKYEILQEALAILLQDIHLKTMVHTQNKITALNERFVENVFHPSEKKGGYSSAQDIFEEQYKTLIKRTGISLAYAQRLMGAFQQLDQEYLTSQTLADALRITTRSANRLLTKLSASGIVEEVEQQHSFTRGRPEKIYRVLMK